MAPARAGAATRMAKILLRVSLVGVGEDETDVALDVREEALPLREVGDEGLDGTANHGVLTHQYDTLTTEGLTDLVHLLGRDIVDLDDEDGLVLLEEVLQLVEVAGLCCRFAPHSVDAV